MPLTDDFDGTYALIGTLTVTTPGGASVVVPIHGIENLTFPPGENKEDKYTPISGARTGYEQVVVCSKLAGDITCRLTYEKAHHLELDAIRGINGSTISLALDDGLTLAATGAVKKLSIAQIEDSKHVTSDLAIAVNANWTLSDAGESPVHVGPYDVTMSGGAATIDLTNANGVDLTGKKVTRLTLIAKSTNANDITIATGASNGYDITASFSVALAASENCTVQTASAPTVGSGEKIFDVSGTTTQGVTVYIEAVDV